MAEEQLTGVIIAAIIKLIITLIGTVVSYVFTKKKEIDAMIRQNKILKYDELLKALAVAVKESLDTNPVWDFIIAYNMASAYANDLVIDACNDFIELKNNSISPPAT